MFAFESNFVSPSRVFGNEEDLVTIGVNWEIFRTSILIVFVVVVMGGVCSGGAAVDDETNRNSRRTRTCRSYLTGIRELGSPHSYKNDSSSYPDYDASGKHSVKCDTRELPFCSPCEAKSPKKSKTGNKVTDFISGKSRFDGSEKAGGVVDTSRSNMTSLKSSSTFVPGVTSRGNEISILAFEVASTITKGANLLQSISDENILFLKERILCSDGIQRLVSTNMEELLRIAASDKREEFDRFLRQLVRFGNLCKDTRWHNLGHFFSKLCSAVKVQKKPREEAETNIRNLVTLAQHTSELYRELHALEKYEQDYRRKLEEVESMHLPRKEENFMLVNSDLNQQRKLVRTLKKKSLWSKSLEEVMEKLVDAVTYIHEEISVAFGNKGTTTEEFHTTQRLGVSGLSLHYANIIKQIESIMCLVSRPYSLPPKTRDTLYHGLPSGVKAALRTRLHSFHSKEELSELQIRAEMEKTLRWMVPIASNTIKSHQGFGSIREWATTSIEYNKKKSAHNYFIRFQTLYHADTEMTECYILELVTWLHRLMNLIRQRYYGAKPSLPARSPEQKKTLHLKLLVQQEPCQASTSMTDKSDSNHQLSEVNQDLLDDASSQTQNPGESKSQTFPTSRKRREIDQDLSLSKSCGSSPSSDLSIIQDFKHMRTNMSDLTN